MKIKKYLKMIVLIGILIFNGDELKKPSEGLHLQEVNVILTGVN
jgi:hypothetical protein